jgi:cytoskeletal protein CcmA (bactofilin family)
MFGWRRRGTIIGEGLKVVGKVTAEGLVKVYGQIHSELQCGSLILSRKAELSGTITAGKVVIDGKVEGPIQP